MSNPAPIPDHTPESVSDPGDLLETWKEIAAYMKRDQRTVKRWERSRSLPVHRLPGGAKATVYASKAELDSWRRSTSQTTLDALSDRPAGRSRELMWAAGLALAICLAAGVAVRMWVERPLDSRMSAVPLTTDQGVEWFPAVSPLGREVAFSWNGETGDNFDIYVKSIGGSRTRLTTDADMDLAPAWSPDGGQLGFVRWRLGAPTFRYIVIPAHGGTEREIGQGRITPNSVRLLFPALAWTPDGSGLIVADAETAQSAYSLKIIAASKGESLPVTKAPQDGPGDCCPAVSPDGRKLAFLRASFDRQLRPLIVEVDRAGRPIGEPRQIEAPACRNPIWSADSSELICIGSNALWRLGVQGGPPRQILTLGVPAQHLSLQRGNLVYSTFAWEGDIWQLQTGGGKTPHRLVASTADDLAPSISPDGTRIGFVSNRSGHLAVWVADRSGANARELAPTVAPNAPAWSPTADAIAYTCRFGNGPEDICTIGVSGGQARRFTAGGARHLFPSWSRDGRSLYFASDRSSGFQIWKAPIDNPANATRLTQGGGYWGTESPDGQSVFYAKTAPSGPIWRVDAGGGDEREVAEEVRSLRLPQNFAVGQDGLYYADSDQPAQGFDIRFWSFAKRKAESIGQIKRGLGNGMALAPDGRTLLFTTMELNSGDLFLISNFQ